MVNVAVAGVGVWGKNVVRNFHEIEKANLLFCYDPNDTSLKWVKDNYPQIKVTHEYKNILNNKKIDAVVIATPPHTHFELARKALEAEKHVLIEKPLTLNSKDAAGLVDLAQKKRRKIMVGHLLKYHPAVGEMRKRIENKEIGEVCYFHSQRLSLGRVRKVENVMWCLATHDVYIAVYLLGEYPERVSAFGKSFLQKEKGIEDVVFLNLFFKGGMFAHIHASWFDVEKVRRLKIIGKEKMMIFDELAPFCKLKIYDRGIVVEENTVEATFSVRDGKVIIPQIEDKQPLKEECLHFIECLEKDKVPFTDGEEGFRVVRILEAAQASLKQEKPVKILIS